MEETNLALTHEEALEILAYLLSSAHGVLTDDYGVYRLASAADRIARFWEPHANGELKKYLHDLGMNMQTNVANMTVDVEGFSTYLNERIAALAKIVKEQGLVGGDE
jgi:hypothetical protein